MAKNISFMQYMRAHGNTPGPTQRPFSTGIIGSLIAFVPFELVLRASGARVAIADAFGISIFQSTAVAVVVMVLAGIVYAAIFKRAANDCRGGWVFGASFGFAVWLLAPITLWQIISGHAAVVGIAAMGLFGSHILFGLVLGLAFPWIHFLIQSRLDSANHRRGDYQETNKEVSDA